MRFLFRALPAVFSFPESDTQHSDHDRRGERNYPHQHITAGIFMQQDRAVHSLGGDLRLTGCSVHCSHKERKQCHAQGRQPADPAELLPAIFFKHPFFHQFDPLFCIIHIVANLPSESKVIKYICPSSN